MIAIPTSCTAGESEMAEMKEMDWQDIYMLLRPLAKRIVYAYRVPAWRGQENDIAEDIIQETVRKLFEYDQKTRRGEVPPIHALLPMIRVVAYNYVKDKRRKDMRVNRTEDEGNAAERVIFLEDGRSIAEQATENAFHDMLFGEMAQEIAHFPSKQKQALLIDLASHMSFEQEPTPLQQAFIKAGIQLQEYRNQLPRTPDERNRYTSLLAHAYKRVSTMECAEKYRSQ